MNINLQKTIKTLFVLLAVVILNTSPAFAAGGDDDNPYYHPPGPTAFGISDAYILSGLSTYTLGSVVLYSAKQLKDKLKT